MSRCRWAWKSTCTPAQRANRLHRTICPAPATICRSEPGRFRVHRLRICGEAPKLPSPRKSRAPPRHLQSWQDLLPRLSLGRRQAGLERVRRVKGQRRDKVNLARARRRSDRPCTHIVLLQTGNFPSPVEYEPKHNACRKLRCFSAFCRVPEALPFDLSLLNVLLLLGESGPASLPI